MAKIDKFQKILTVELLSFLKEQLEHLQTKLERTQKDKTQSKKANEEATQEIEALEQQKDKDKLLISQVN